MEKHNKLNKTLISACIISVIFLIIDQITKIIFINGDINVIIIKNVLELHTVYNKGGAFGVGQGNTAMFIITNLVVLGLIIRFIYLQKDLMNKTTLYSLNMKLPKI